MTPKKILLIFLFYCIITSVYTQAPGCPNVVVSTQGGAQGQVTIPCNNCVDLVATPLHTGQTNTYAVSSIPYAPPYPYNAGNPVLVNIDDRWSGIINLPFHFCFFATAYNQIIAGSNGVISFDVSNAGGFCPWSYTATCPSPNLPLNAVFGPYHDIDPAVAGSMYQAVFGSYPCRTFVVNYYQIPMFSTSCNHMIATHQIVLYEATNVVEVYMQNKPLCTTWNGGRAVVGIQNQAGNQGFTAPGRNTSQWTANNEAWRFTPNGAQNYTIQWLQGGNVIGTGPNINVCPTVPTTYTAEVTYTNCNGSVVVVADQITVSTGSLTTTISPANADICIGESVNIQTTATGNAPFTYSWSPATGINNTSVANPVVNPTSTTTYTVTITDAGGCSAAQSSVITVYPTPNANAGNNTSMCIGGSTNLNASGGPNFTWSPATGLSSTTIHNPIASPTITTTYTVTVSASQGCSASDNVVITVNPFPTANAGTDQIICVGQSVNLTAFGGTSYAWSNNVQTQSINVSPTTTTTYTVTVTDVNGCSNTDNVVVNVNMLPSASAGSNVAICTGHSTQLNASGGINYSWSPATGLSSTTISNPTASPTVTTTYTVTVTDLNGCTNTDNVIISVLSPSGASAGSPTAICIGNSATLTATGGNTYVWNTGAQTASIMVSPATTTTYTVTVTDQNSCTATASVVVQVNPLPLADAGQNAAVCLGNSTTLNASGGVAYSWSPSTGLSTINSASPVANPTVTTTYTVTVTDANGCSNTDDVVVSVFPKPIIDFTAGTLSGCAPLYVSFTDLTVPTPQQWLWNFGDLNATQNTSTQQNPSHVYAQSGTYTVSLSVTTLEGCTDTHTKNNFIAVYPNPIASFTAIPSTASISHPTIQFADASINAHTWHWNFGEDASGSNNYSNIQSPSHTYASDGTFSVTLIVETQHGCIDSTFGQVIIQPEFMFYIPNAFTPGGDGINDVFSGYGTNISEFEMHIFNRWGEMIFSTNNIKEGWDGRKQNTDEICPQDVYVYKITVKDKRNKTHQYYGHVTLLNNSGYW